MKYSQNVYKFMTGNYEFTADAVKRCQVAFSAENHKEDSTGKNFSGILNGDQINNLIIILQKAHKDSLDFRFRNDA